MGTVSIPDHYGDKVCTVCTLTVAEYVNGREYALPDGGRQYVHDGCWEGGESDQQLTK
jgi:hypothetical protein